jgi:hypothetical protein
MSRQLINLGNENAGNGDPLRIAFEKVNDNFTEVYALLGGPATDLQELAQDYAAEMLTTVTHNGIITSYNNSTNKLTLTVVIDGGTASTVF